jgi:hypothetical protein
MTWRARIFITVIGIVLGAAREPVAGTIYMRCEPNMHEHEAAGDVRYYDRVLGMYDHDPRCLEDAHPFYARLLADPSDMDVLIDRLESHERRFEYWHPSLTRFLEGYIDSDLCLPVGDPPAPGGNSRDDGSGVGANSVPEPSTGVLMISSLIIGLLCLRPQTFSRPAADASDDDSAS